ncbi:hypothetical protein Syun_017098 [Stephania yunnanensis]|uniref:RNase H type-1 domain-containing protein n=1 Tax=Stephania yunnanensis TaxID=152371 RepID=A0AAP0J6B2_9MAGN
MEQFASKEEKIQQQGSFEIGMARYSGLSNQNWAELEQVWRKGYKQLVVELDFKEAVGLLVNSPPGRFWDPLVDDKLKVATKEWKIVLRQTYRENNACVDHVANEAFQNVVSFKVWDTVPAYTDQSRCAVTLDNLSELKSGVEELIHHQYLLLTSEIHPLPPAQDYAYSIEGANKSQ